MDLILQRHCTRRVTGFAVCEGTGGAQNRV